VGFPPLRFEEDVKAIWDGLSRGTIHVLASDHAPYSKEMKLDPSLDITNPRPGVSNLQVMFPLLYSEGVRGGKITLEQFVALTSTNAAKLFGLFPRKGTVAVGSDADLVLWDPDETRTIRIQDMLSRSDFTVYEGMEVTGWPKVTILRGEVVYHKRQVLGKPGFGKVLLREKFQPLSLGGKG
jgi:dihydropyrimidinase